MSEERLGVRLGCADWEGRPTLAGRESGVVDASAAQIACNRGNILSNRVLAVALLDDAQAKSKTMMFKLFPHRRARRL